MYSNRQKPQALQILSIELLDYCRTGTFLSDSNTKKYTHQIHTNFRIYSNGKLDIFTIELNSMYY